MFKLVATDCDNTLLDSTAHIPQRNIDIIKKLSEKGIKFIIATGRNDILVKDYIYETGITAPVIGCNGATIRDFSTNELFRYAPIPKESVREVLNLLKKENIHCKAFSLTHGYSDESLETTKNLASVIPTYTKVLTEQLIYETLDDIYDIVDKEILKIVVVDKDYDFLSETQKKIKAIDGIDIVRSARMCIDVSCKGVSKGSALAFYAEKLGIRPEEVIAFGDSENDLSMLEYAGLSVAMENGEQSLKQKADITAPSNNDAGVAQVLEKVFSDLL